MGDTGTTKGIANHCTSRTVGGYRIETDKHLKILWFLRLLVTFFHLQKRHIMSFRCRKKEIEAELVELVYQNAKLSETQGNGCKLCGQDIIRDILIEEKRDELRATE